MRLTVMNKQESPSSLIVRIVGEFMEGASADDCMMELVKEAGLSIMAHKKGDGWIDHDGESWPACKPSGLIEVERRNGYGHTDFACGFMWLSSGSPYDIIRYRKVAS